MLKEGIHQEETPAHDAVREALINCIVHNDINALGHIIVELIDDRLVFRNTGMMLVSKQQYIKGGRIIGRNSILQNIFMRLGGAERAGSGVDKIVGGWKYLELPEPMIEEEIRPDYVVFTLYLKRDTPQDTPQDTNRIIRKEHNRNRLLEFCVEPRSVGEMMQLLGLKARKNFMESYINPMLTDGVLVKTKPDKQISGEQRYVRIKI